MAKKAKAKTKKVVSFEESIAQLEGVVRDLEEGNLSLDESLERYEQGVGFLKRCQEILAGAERRIEILSGVDAEGNPVTRRFDDEELSLEEKADQRSRRRSAKTNVRQSEAKLQESSSDEFDVDENGTLF